MIIIVQLGELFKVVDTFSGQTELSTIHQVAPLFSE